MGRGMSLKFGILGLLAEQPLHAYSVKARFQDLLGGSWEVNIGQVYTTLQRLERDGLVEPAESRGDRGRLPYRLTEAGRKALEAWLPASAGSTSSGSRTWPSSRKRPGPRAATTWSCCTWGRSCTPRPTSIGWMPALRRSRQEMTGDDGAGGRVALDGVSLAIEGGELTAIMGPSGSGKSTLLNLVAGVDRPSGGRVRVAGEDLGRLSEARLVRFRRARLGFVFQFFNLLGNLTVLENVLIPAQLQGTRPAPARARAMELLARLDIAELAGHYPARLSGGQQQRVAVARALINQPLLLLADEPTGAMDTHSGGQVMELIEGLNHEGQTVLLVTHDAKLATRHAGRVVTLIDGRVVDDTRLEGASPLRESVVEVRIREGQS